MKHQGLDPNNPPDAKLPIQARIYKTFKNKFTKHSNVLLIKSPQGQLIGVYLGQNINIKQLNTDDDTSNLITTINGNKLFAYDVNYAVYPATTIRAMYTNSNAPNEKLNKTVTAKQATPTDSNNSKKNKK